MRRIKQHPIVIPAVTFGVKVRLGGAGLTPIERVSIEAIGSGVHDVRMLESLLGLGQRPTMDLLYDLWRAGHVLMGGKGGQVQLVGAALRHFRAGTLDQLQSAERNLRTVNLLQELLTGAVLPWRGTSRPEGPDSALVPTPRATLDLSGITGAELNEAVVKELERSRNRASGNVEERKLDLMETWTDPSQLMFVPSADAPHVQSRRFLTVYVDVWIQSGAGRLSFEVVHAPDLPPTLRRNIGRALTQCAERDAGLLFYKRLRQELERIDAPEAPRAKAEVFARLVEVAEGLAGTDFGNVPQRHAAMRALWADAQDELDARYHAQAQTALIVGYRDHDEALRTLAAAAKRQLVLANPWISLDGLLSEAAGESWLTLLIRLLRQGVRVVILWGISEDESLPADVKNAMEDLRARFPSLFVRSVHVANLHAKVAIRDAEEAIVTSYNFLHPPRQGDSLELGVRVWGAQEGRCPRVIAELLDWARRVFPEHLGRAQINNSPDTLGAEAPPARSSSVEPSLPDLASGDLEHRALSQAIWAKEWRALAQEAQHHAETLGEGVTLIEGGEHKAALWDALMSSQSRLVVLSDKLSVDVVNDRFVRALQTRFDAEVPCSFMFRREGATDSEDGPAARLIALAKARPTLCRLAPARSHAKVLISDDRLTIGSFNFLSYSGESSGVRGRPERAELSVTLRSAGMVEQVLLRLDELAPGAFAPLFGRSTAKPTGSWGARSATLQPLVDALHADGPETLRAWFTTSASPWRDLDELRGAGVSPELLQRATLAALAYSPDRDGTERDRWRTEAALVRWTAGDFLGAALLLPEPAPAGTVLRPELARLGAFVQADISGKLPEFSPRTADEAAALLVLALSPMLLGGDFEALRQQEDWTGMLPRPLRPWLKALNRYQSESRGRPLEMGLLLRHASEADQRRAAQAAFADLNDAVARAIQVGFLFPVGKHTWDRLRAEGGFLGVLEAAVRAKDVEHLSQYLQRLEADKKSPENLMDEASAASADAHGNQRIELRKREPCVKRLDRAYEAARSWVAAEGALQLAPEDENALRHARALSESLVALGDLSLLSELPLASAALSFTRAKLRPLIALERQ